MARAGDRLHGNSTERKPHSRSKGPADDRGSVPWAVCKAEIRVRSHILQPQRGMRSPQLIERCPALIMNRGRLQLHRIHPYFVKPSGSACVIIMPVSQNHCQGKIRNRPDKLPEIARTAPRINQKRPPGTLDQLHRFWNQPRNPQHPVSHFFHRKKIHTYFLRLHLCNRPAARSQPGRNGYVSVQQIKKTNIQPGLPACSDI